jgi:hypothetical protein
MCFSKLNVAAFIARVYGLISTVEVSNMITSVTLKSISGMYHENEVSIILAFDSSSGGKIT